MYKTFKSVKWVFLAIVSLGLSLVSGAASPPGLVNYQGVLRNASGAPLTGSYDMVFRFYSASSGGDQILVDTHTGGAQVGVVGGLFTTALGGGTVTDGTGPGTYTSLANTFRDYGTVYVEIVVGGETLNQRVRVVSSAYALNADNLDGLDSASFSPASHNHAGTYLPLAGGTMAGNIAFSGAQTVDGVDLSAGATTWNNHLAATSSVHGLTYTAEGSGGGLDADTVDGQHASAFMGSGTDNWVNTTGDTMTGTLTLNPTNANGVAANLASSAAVVNITNSGAGVPIVTTTHRAGTMGNPSYALSASADGSGGDGANIGVHGQAANSLYNVGVEGAGSGSTGEKRGVSGWATGSGTNYGGYFKTDDALGTNNYGIYSAASGGGTNWAGYFNGNVGVTGKLSTSASATSGAGLVLPHGTAPSSPVNGDLWTTTGGLYARINSSTVGPFTTASGHNHDLSYVNVLGDTMTGTLTLDPDNVNGISSIVTSSANVLDITNSGSGTPIVAQRTGVGGTEAWAIKGLSAAPSSWGCGLFGQSTSATTQNRGISGAAFGNTGDKIGAYGDTSGAGTNYGGYFKSVYSPATTNYGVYGEASGATTNYAGYFSGHVNVTGKLTTKASASGGAGLTLPHGAAPSAPVNGDLWTTTGGLYTRVNGSTVGPLTSASGHNHDAAYVNVTGDTMTGTLTLNPTNVNGIEADITSSIDVIDIVNSGAGCPISATSHYTGGSVAKAIVGNAAGVRATGTSYGVSGLASGSAEGNVGVDGFATGSGETRGISGYADGSGTNYGGYFRAHSFAGTACYGVYGKAEGAITNYAGYFDGNVKVDGTVTLNPTNANGLSANLASSAHVLNITNSGAGTPIVADKTGAVGSESYGIWGKTSAPASYGCGLFGQATSATTQNRGISGIAFGDSGWKIGAYGDTSGAGTNFGGYFKSTSGTATANYGVYALANGGTTNYGIYAEGETAGAYLVDSSTNSYCIVGSGNYGIEGHGATSGAYFTEDDAGGVAEAWIGRYLSASSEYWGIRAWGATGGAYLGDNTSSAYARAGYDTYKISGTGTVSFIQNHPERGDQVIVYAAPEGDEVATYTRGSARLVNGEARVKLGETFRWVTNPGIGLTAHLTPRGDCNGLYAETLSTSEMVVKELAGGKSNTPFDYVVYGLRIGFEEVGIVQEKKEESYIPAMVHHRELFARQPALRAFNALERFKGMRVQMGAAEPFDLSGALALKEAIHEFDPAVDRVADEREPGAPGASRVRGTGTPSRVSAPAPPAPSSGRVEKMDRDSSVPARREAAPVVTPAISRAERFPICEPVEAGDVLTNAPEHPGAFCLAKVMNDPGVVGIVMAEAVGAPSAKARSESAPSYDTAPVATSGVVLCKADATLVPIAANDLLMASPIPGHAMKAAKPIEPGTVIGKALEPLRSGTGLIKVMVMLR